MLKTCRSTRALHETRASKEDAIVEESSSRTKNIRSRRVLGDASNDKARNRAALGGDKRTAIGDTEKQLLRRSRRLSTVGFTREVRNLINEDETKSSIAQIEAQNMIANKEGSCEMDVTKSYNDNDALTSTETGDTKTIKLTTAGCGKTEVAATIVNNSTNRAKKRVNGGDFDIESALLEPRPKRNRKKLTKRVAKKRKTEAKTAEGKAENNVEMIDSAEEKQEKNVQTSDSKMKTPDAVLSELPSSTVALNPSGHRRLDPVLLSDDDHCLPRKLEGPFDASKFTSGIATYDKASEGNIGEVPAYVTDIFQRLFDAERDRNLSPFYMTEVQDEINSTMRAILVDWLVGVQMKFRLQPETLYLCVNIIDRYLSKSRIRRRRLQLLGITALFVACKYEEIYPLEVKDCVYVTHRAYNRQEVIDMEFELVMVLGFKMTVPTAYPFLQRFLHITNAPKMIRDLASFYTERMLQEYCMLNFRSSLVASAAVFLAWNTPTAIKDFENMGIVHELPKVLETIVNYTGFCEKQIRHTAIVMCRKIQPSSNSGQRPRAQLDKVHMKYRYEAYSKVSYFELPIIDS